MTTVCGEPQELEDEGSDPPTLPRSARKDGAPGLVSIGRAGYFPVPVRVMVGSVPPLVVMVRVAS
jgi:hypothetical protein